MNTDYAVLGRNAEHWAIDHSLDEKQSSANVGKGRLLIVDDVPENREILRRRFERHGFRATEAAGGIEALDLIERETFDLVLLDMMMPDVDGLDVLARIRAKYSQGFLPVIMVTAKSQSEDIVEALSRGANDYITKPVDFSIALARVTTQIDRKRSEEKILQMNEELSRANEALDFRVAVRTKDLVQSNQQLRSEIEQRTKIEAQTLAAKNRLQATIDAIPDLLFEVGLDSRIYDYHSPRTELLVAPPEVFLGKLMSEVLPAEAASVWLEALGEASVKGLSSGMAYALQLSHGERWLELSVAAMPATGGEQRRFIALARDITERKAADEEIKNLAFYDLLTKLPNRRLLLEQLKRAIASSTRSGRCGALVFIDLDNFKTLNDTLGHDSGDRLLQQAAERLRGCIRENDTAARLGGDEFVVLLEDLSSTEMEAAAQVEVIGEKILAALSCQYQFGSYTHQSTASMGITLFSSHHGSVDDLLKRADLALYQAKAEGRNTLCFFEPEMQSIVTARTTLEAGLRSAVENDQFVLYYQAQVDRGGRLLGAEALVRWCHPKRGIVSPNEFIPFAEDSGLILPIGHWVMRSACAQLAVWADRIETAHLTISVNVSARQFHQKNFVDQVLGVLEETGANPQRLKLELTESLLVANVESVVTKMTELKANGVSFSLDDFGTGYSSLSCLKRLPLDQLKIDQGFVRNILTDSDDAAIAKMVIALAESMALEVIAEGVETEAQRDFLAYHGCLAYQGYLFGRPLPLEEFEFRYTFDRAK